MAISEKKIIVRAKINRNIVIIDLASESKSAYSDILRPIEYLGEGKYYSYDGQLATDKKSFHFWKFKS